LTHREVRNRDKFLRTLTIALSLRKSDEKREEEKKRRNKHRCGII
jgi:hypothetical protein